MPRTSTRSTAWSRAASRPDGPAYQNTPALSKSQAKIVDIARRFQTLKEDAKHHSLSEMAVLRRAVLTLDRRFGLDGRVFWLRFDELLSLNGQNAHAAARAGAGCGRRRRSVCVTRPSLPSVLLAHDLEAASAGDASDNAAHAPTPSAARACPAARSSRPAPTSSRRRTPSSATRWTDFRDGDIIVAAMINPAWLPYFSRAGGFVSEVGGWLSHPAILAREYDVAMIVGTEGIGRIADGTGCGSISMAGSRS